MKDLKNKIGFAVCAGVLILMIACGIFFPQAYEGRMPYRFYNVLTNSMEPEIETNSLVLVKAYDKQMHLKEGDIITFQAKRFGEDIIVTHRFSHTETNEKGELLYRTHPEQSDVLDSYETTEEDILGVCVFHIPYIGRLPMFLKSRFGFLWLCEVILILMIKHLILLRWEEKSASIMTS